MTWSAEIRQAWAAVPVHAVVQFIRSDGLHLWWRHGEQGKVFATWAGGRWTWVFRRDAGQLTGGGWTWDRDREDRDRDDIRDFVVIAHGITPDLSNEEVERRCTVQGASVGEWIAWDDVPVDSLVYVEGGHVALRRADERSFWVYHGDCGDGWWFRTKQAWSVMAGGQCKVIARDLTPDQEMCNLKSLTRNELSRDELALVGLT